MPQITIDVYGESLDAIVCHELKLARESFVRDLEGRKQGDTLDIFSTDKDTDIRMIQERIDAIDLLIGYFEIHRENIE